jgi:hypothetical protein
MIPIRTSALLLAAALFTPLAIGQVEGPQPTQALINVTSKSPTPITPADITLDLNNKSVPVASLTVLPPRETQVAILIDDGLRTSVARQLDDIRKFIQALPQGTEVFVGYMQNGRVEASQPFTSNLASAASTLRIPFGSPGISASPYFCLSDFSKHWPTEAAYGAPQTPGRKARFVLMLTNGVDPYNGSVSPLNQDSPYVQTAINDAQRAGIVVSAIYYGDAGIRGGAANFSGQNYLAQVSEATGGYSYWQGRSNPVSLAPYLTHFAADISQTYVATFTAPTSRELVSLRVKTHEKGVKLRSAQAIRPGAEIVSAGE